MSQEPESHESAAIVISGLNVQARIGVTEAERASPQRLEVSVRYCSAISPRQTDEITDTVDYAAVAGAVKAIVGERQFKLIETVAAEIATRLMTDFPLQHIEVEVRKFVLAETDYVSATITQGRDSIAAPDRTSR